MLEEKIVLYTSIRKKLEFLNGIKLSVFQFPVLSSETVIPEMS